MQVGQKLQKRHSDILEKSILDTLSADWVLWWCLFHVEGSFEGSVKGFLAGFF